MKKPLKIFLIILASPFILLLWLWENLVFPLMGIKINRQDPDN